ncbi:MAG: LytTR family DNA-binding domain-containing protein [Bacteroidota bacterium]
MTHTLKAILIDDEPNCLQDLSELIADNHPEIEVKATAEDVEGGVAVIRENDPDILFLDIELHDKTSFDILEQLDFGRYAIVFVTAHNEYATRAFNFSAMAYLNKPVEEEDLALAIARAQKRLAERPYEETIQDLKEMIQQIQEKRLPHRITISNSEGLHFVQIADITHFESDHGCVMVHTVQDRRITVSSNLVTYEKLLNPYGHFVRCNKSFLVNINQIVHAKPYNLTMSTGKTVPCSQGKWGGLLGRL